MTVIDTPEGIQFAKLCALRGAVKMEIRGMRRRGRSATVLAKELLGLKNSTSKVATLAALETEIERLRQARQHTLDMYRDMEDNQRYQEACERGKLDV
jgi:hypothetical protein